MKRVIIIPLLLLSLTLGATKYYIATTGTDGAGINGSISNPWLTLGYAVTRVSSPDSIYVKPGTYNISTQVDLPVGISIIGEGSTSILNATAAVNPLIELWSTTEGTNGNQSISYLKLDGNNLTGTRAILVNLRSNVNIHHLNVEEFSSIGIEFDGIAVNPSPVTHSTGNSIYECVLTNTCGRGGAIRFNGQSGILIYNNIITGHQRSVTHDPTLVSMVGGYSKGVKFYANNLTMDTLILNGAGATMWGFHVESWDCQGGYEFYDNTFNGGHVPIDVGGTFNVKGDYDYSWDIYDNVWKWAASSPTQIDGSFGLVFEGGVSDIIIRNNRFSNVPWGINSSIVQEDRVHERIYIYYNIFDNIGWGNDTWSFGIWIGQNIHDAVTRDIYIYNNIFHTNGNAMRAGIVLNADSLIQTVMIKNNIINGTAGYGAVTYWDGDGIIDDISVQNNIWYGNADTTYYRNGKTISNSVYSGNSTANPLFKSAATFRLKNTSPTINAGTDVSLVYDHYGHKITGTPDIGAMEYGKYIMKTANKTYK